MSLFDPPVVEANVLGIDLYVPYGYEANLGFTLVSRLFYTGGLFEGKGMTYP